jgi:hypothetical protein
MPQSNHSRNAIARFLAVLIVAVVLALVTGLVHGRLTQRWGPVPDLQAAGKKLEEFPTKIGDWELLSEAPMAEGVQQILTCAGYINRQYVNRQSGETVSVAMIVGPSGPTAVHTPEICYSSRAYSIQRPRERVEFSDKDGRTHSIWSLSFRPNNPSMDRLLVYYAWRADETWTASDSPRFEFAGRRMLVKLQMACNVPSTMREGAQDPCQEFFAALLQSGWKVGIENQ